MKNIVSAAGILFIFLFTLTLGTVFHFLGDAGSVAYEEVGPKAALQKYEWFKNAHAQLSAKRQNIQNYQQRVNRLKDGAQSNALQQQELFQSESELQGLIMAYNNLAEEYNSASSKFNWNFAKSDELPQNIEPWQSK